VDKFVARARKARHIAVDTELVMDPGVPTTVDPLRSRLVAISIAVAPGEAYYFPLAHVEHRPAQGELLVGAGGAAGAGSATAAEGDDGRPAAEGDGAPADGAADGAPDAAAPRPKARKKAATRREPQGIAQRWLAERGAESPRNLPPLDDPQMAAFRALLEDASVPKTMQHGKFDILALRRAGITLRGLEFDTMLASYVLDPGRRSHGLDTLALEFLDYRMTSYEDLCGPTRSQIGYDAVPIPCARDYSCEDADITLQLREKFEPQLAELELTRLFADIEIPLVAVLAEMEWTGIAIDLDWFRSLKTRFQSEREAVEQEIYRVAGTEFNINSNPQLRDILFERLQLPIVKRTATGPSTDASVLQELAEEGHALPRLLMEYRELAKLESTYIDALPAYLNPHTRRLHTSFSQTVASTGRLSSSDPNLQNIPIRRALGRDIRRGFVPRTGWKLLAADYSQIELRLLAHLSNDPAFVAAFRAGGDIHRQTASIIFDVPTDEVTSEMRARAKTINFATIYGQGPHALSRQLQISHAEAKEFIERYFERFRGIREYLDSQVALAREQGFVQTIFGRRRYIPELRDRNFNIRAFGERTAANSPIQGSAADLIKIAMIRIDHQIRKRALASRMLLQVHDELVFEVPAPELPAVREMVRHEMEHAAELSVPLVVDMGEGENWLETKG
jgi:DNA polymerase-1